MVYGSLNPSLRNLLWETLNRKWLNLIDSWLVMGDFNLVVMAEEVTHPEKMDPRRYSGFVDWIAEHDLVDMGYSRPHFT